jgi:hypothetical protein
VQATLEFFEADKATTKLLLRDAYALGERFEQHLGGLYERFIDDIDNYMSAPKCAASCSASRRGWWPTP